MIDPANAVEVLVKPYGSADAYHEYKASTASKLYPGDRNECYVEAITNERFVVEIILHPLFRWKGSPDPEGRNSNNRERVTQTVSTVNRFTDGTWHRCGLVFGKVQMNDNESASPADKADQEVVKQGKIVVRLQRGKAGTSKRKAYSPPAAEHLCVPAKSTKRAVVDSVRSHYAKSVTLSVLEPEHADSSVHWAEAKGDAGVEIQFTILYTSRMFLNIQGLIPLIDVRKLEHLDMIEEPSTGMSTAAGSEAKQAAVDGLQGGIGALGSSGTVVPALRGIVDLLSGSKDTDMTTMASSLAGSTGGVYPGAHQIQSNSEQLDSDPRLASTRVKTEATEDLYNATPRPPNMRASTQPASATASAMSQSARARRRAEILARQEEIELARELRDLDEAEETEQSGDNGQRA